MAILRTVLVVAGLLAIAADATPTLSARPTRTQASVVTLRRISAAKAPLPLLSALRGGAEDLDGDSGEDLRTVTFRRAPSKLADKESLYVSGDCDALGNSDAAKAVLMKQDKVNTLSASHGVAVWFSWPQSSW